MSRLLLIVVGCCLFGAGWVRAEALVAPPGFIVGVWYQPINSFAKWKARGINTLVGCELEGGNATREQWCRAAREAGLFYIIRPTTDADQRKADILDPWLIAWEQQDEPDGGGNVAPDEIVNRYKEFKTFGDKPVFINFDGWKMQWRPAADYQTYVQGADWLAIDYYVINRGEGPDATAKIGDRLDKLKAWTDGKKRLMTFIECSDQNLRVQEWTQNPDASGSPPAPRMRCPTAGEVQAQVKMTVDHGGTGIIYFPQAIGHNFESFDATPVALVDVIVAINQKLTGAGGPAVNPLSPTSAPVAPAIPQPRVSADAAVPTTQPTDWANRRVIIDGKTYRLVPE